MWILKTGHVNNTVKVSPLSCQPDPVPEAWTLDTMTEKSLGLDPEVAGVIAGHDLHISFVKLVKAASFLSRPEVVFLATNTDGQFPMKSSQVVVPGQRPASACLCPVLLPGLSALLAAFCLNLCFIFIYPSI